MHILLIQPKMNKRPMDTDLKTKMSPSLALLTLASLTPSEHTVTILNENIESIDYRCHVDLVGITVTLDVFPRAVAIAEKFKLRGIPVAAGGIHVTCEPNSCKYLFDALCIGFGERIWPRLVADAAQGKLKPIYQDMEEFQGSEIVFPNLTGSDLKKYLYTNVIMTSRGCPNRCGFCYNSCENRNYILRPIEDVLQDIERMGTRHILFTDDNFIGTPSYTKALLLRLRGKGLKWGAAVTTNILNHLTLLDLMKETGCQSLFIGFESINNASLDSVNKKNRFEHYERLAEEIHKRGIMINASMVFGLDGDGPDVFQNTLDFLVKNRIETLTSHILTPYPGTALYHELETQERITDYDLSKYNTAHVVFEPAKMSKEELYEGYLWMYKHFYSFRNIMRRMPLDKSQRCSYLLFNLLYRKFGCITSAIAHIIPMRTLGKLAARLSYKVR